MMTKYNFEIDNKLISQNINRLTNQIWKIIPMFENEEDWRRQLISVLIEIVGLNEIFSSSAGYLQVLTKLEGLQCKEVEFDILRKTIFESITLLQELKREWT